MRVTPTARISRVETSGTDTSVVIPGRLKLVALLLLVWLSFWTYGGFKAITAFAASLREGKVDWFLAVWLLGWAAGELIVIGVLAYMVGGREVTTVRQTELEIRLQIFGLSVGWQYELARVKNLRVHKTAGGRSQFPAALAFDYGAKTIRFGRGIDEAEAFMVLDDLRGTGRLPATAA